MCHNLAAETKQEIRRCIVIVTKVKTPRIDLITSYHHNNHACMHLGAGGLKITTNNNNKERHIHCRRAWVLRPQWQTPEILHPWQQQPSSQQQCLPCRSCTQLLDWTLPLAFNTSHSIHRSSYLNVKQRVTSTSSRWVVFLIWMDGWLGFTAFWACRQNVGSSHIMPKLG